MSDFNSVNSELNMTISNPVLETRPQKFLYTCMQRLLCIFAFSSFSLFDLEGYTALYVTLLHLNPILYHERQKTMRGTQTYCDTVILKV